MRTCHSDELKKYLELYGFEGIRVINGGDEIMAKCPFAVENHEGGIDANPSWGINVKTGIWNCFGCKESGNLYTLADKLDIPVFAGITHGIVGFKESLKAIKGKLKSDIKQKNVISNSVLPDEFELFNFEVSNDRALNWLREEKNYKDSTIKYFGVGKKNGNPVFPFADEDNFIVGWQERNLDYGDYGPKYYNLEGFKKTDYLYNIFNVLNNSWPGFENEVIVVEALLSVLSLFEVGIPAVSVGGSAISNLQAAKLINFRKATICFDNDKAGYNGIKCAKELLKAAPFKVYYSFPPHGTKIHRMSRDNLKNIIDNKKILIER